MMKILSKCWHFFFSVCGLEHLFHWQLVGVHFLFEFSTEISWKLHTVGHLYGATVQLCLPAQMTNKVERYLYYWISRTHCNDVFHPTIQIWWKVCFLVFPFLAVWPGLSDHYRFCTCHDSCAVMACAKICSDLSIDISMTSILNFHLSWIRRGNTKWALHMYPYAVAMLVVTAQPVCTINYNIMGDSSLLLCWQIDITWTWHWTDTF